MGTVGEGFSARALLPLAALFVSFMDRDVERRFDLEVAEAKRASGAVEQRMEKRL
ncbi:MAG: hypothetical protein JWP44_5063 [Mucilaginibacter sp.]|nr:hypothetical protein [Mucilaginibacter sp.]